MHKDLLPKHLASMLEGSNPPAGNQYILNSNLSGLGSPAGQVHATVPGTGKRRRLEKRTLSLEDADRPQEETEELKRKVRDLERKVISYKKTVETLLDVIRNFLSRQTRKLGYIGIIEVQQIYMKSMTTTSCPFSTAHEV